MSQSGQPLGALMNQAAAHRQAGQLVEALAAYDVIVLRSPGDAQALNMRGGLLGEMGRIDEALADFDRALVLNPSQAELHFNRGLAFMAARRWSDALAGFDRAIELKPAYPEALNNRGLVLQAMGRNDDALADFARSLEIVPNYVRAFNNRGAMLKEMGRLDEALADFDAAIKIEPRFAEAQANRGAALTELARFDEALACFKAATSLSPRHARAHAAEGSIRLLQGDFEHGLSKREWRDGGTFSASQNDYPQPAWRPTTNSAGKAVYIHGSESLADNIQFARYLEKVAAGGAAVTLSVPGRLKTLMEQQAGVKEVRAFDDPLPEFDMHRALASLPFAFGTRLDSIPSQVPYIAAPDELAEKWKGRLAVREGLRVGICWRADPAAGNGASIPGEIFASLAAIDGVRLIALQRTDATDAPLPPTIETLGANFHPDVADFTELAAIVANLDVVISADSAIAHLAGAMGRKVWLALKTVPDWRWMLERSDSPWYPTMRLFRQTTRDEWGPVLADITKALEAEAKR